LIKLQKVPSDKVMDKSIGNIDSVGYKFTFDNYTAIFLRLIIKIKNFKLSQEERDCNTPLPMRATPIDIPMNFDLVQIDAFIYICFTGLSK